MSGPKVVRIVTRDEVIAICEGHLARVDAALEDWIRAGQRNDCADEAAIAMVRRRRDELRALLIAGRFMDLQKQAPLEEIFLRSDMERRLAKIAADQAAARTRERRSAAAATALIKALETSGRAVDDELAGALQRSARGDVDSKAISAGFALLSAPDLHRSEAAVSQAGRLRDGEVSRSYADWLTTLPSSPMDAAIERLDERIAAVMQLGEEQRVMEWRRRISDAMQEGDQSRRSLLIDGLDVELGRALTKARSLHKAKDELVAVSAETVAMRLPAIQTLNALLSSDDLATIEAAIADARATVERQRASMAAAARRAAVLQSLSGLGYEVTEGMSTSWVEDGRVVLKRAVQPDYGVEISGDAEGGRLQMRPVAFTVGGAGPDPRRDADAETVWCGDVGQLSSKLARAGGGLVIERSLPVGTTPLKRIQQDLTSSTSVDSIVAPAVRAKSLN